MTLKREGSKSRRFERSEIAAGRMIIMSLAGSAHVFLLIFFIFFPRLYAVSHFCILYPHPMVSGFALYILISSLLNSPVREISVCSRTICSGLLCTIVCGNSLAFPLAAVRQVDIQANPVTSYRFLPSFFLLSYLLSIMLRRSSFHIYHLP